MKTSSKLIAIVLGITAMLFSSKLKAQTLEAHTLKLVFGVDASEPTGSAAFGSNFSLGGNGQLQYATSNSFALTFTSGADHFFMKDRPGTDARYDSYGIIPIRAGVKEFFIPNVYIAGEAGVGIEAVDSKDGPWTAHLDLSPSLGLASGHWDFSFRYDNYSRIVGHYGLVGVRLAYGFKL